VYSKGEYIMDDEKEDIEGKKEDTEKKLERQKGFIQTVKAIDEQKDALREMASNREVEKKNERSFDKEKTEAESFYQGIFGVKVDFTDVKVPPKPQTYFNLILLPIVKKITLDKIILRNRTDCLIRVSPFINPETLSSPYVSFRAYMAWAINGEHPDLRIMNQRSTNGKRVMTVEERVLLGLKRFQTADENQNKYLDMEMPTLTSSYVQVGKEMKAVVVRYQNGGMYIDAQNINTPGGAREMFGLD
jgi:hypothetical protein